MEKYITFAVEEHMTGQTVEKVLRTALGISQKSRSAVPNFNRTGYVKTVCNAVQPISVQTSDRDHDLYRGCQKRFESSGVIL